jgi:LysR family positive regulator for ilvC
METRDLRAFSHLASTLHFARSARALGMSPSALTRRIQALEEELGHPLLLRDARQVRLTRAGEILRRFARAQLEQHAELESELRREEQAPTGELSLACTVTACLTVLPDLLARFRATYPGITLRLVTQDAERSLEQLEAGDVDVAVIPTDPAAEQELAQLLLASTELALIAPASAGALTPRLLAPLEHLAELPFVAQPRGLERKRLDTWLAARGARPRIVAEVHGNEGIIAMVGLGAGVALVPRLVLESSPLGASVREVAVGAAPPGYDVSLCALPRSLERRVIAALFDVADAARAVRASGAQ